MRIQKICRKYNIDFDRVEDVLNNNGYNGFISPNTKLDSKYLEIFGNEFREDREKKEISKKMIENRKNTVLVNNGFPKYKNAISNYTDTYNKAIKAYHSATDEIKHIEKNIDLCILQQKQYWGLNTQECEVLINSKYEQIIEIVASIEYILHSYDPQNISKYLSILEPTTPNNNENLDNLFLKINSYDELNCSENYEDISENNAHDDFDDIDFELESSHEQTSNNFNVWESYHNSSDNPWVNVFGMGDEAETAYWNTD